MIEWQETKFKDGGEGSGATRQGTSVLLLYGAYDISDCFRWLRIPITYPPGAVHRLSVAGSSPCCGLLVRDHPVCVSELVGRARPSQRIASPDWMGRSGGCSDHGPIRHRGNDRRYHPRQCGRRVSPRLLSGARRPPHGGLRRTDIRRNSAAIWSSLAQAANVMRNDPAYGSCTQPTVGFLASLRSLSSPDCCHSFLPVSSSTGGYGTASIHHIGGAWRW